MSIKKVSIEFNTENAAFENDELFEIGVLLRQIADRIERRADYTIIRDYNGNIIGKLTLTY